MEPHRLFALFSPFLPPLSRSSTLLFSCPSCLIPSISHPFLFWTIWTIWTKEKIDKMKIFSRKNRPLSDCWTIWIKSPAFSITRARAYVVAGKLSKWSICPNALKDKDILRGPLRTIGQFYAWPPRSKRRASTLSATSSINLTFLYMTMPTFSRSNPCSLIMRPKRLPLTGSMALSAHQIL